MSEIEREKNKHLRGRGKGGGEKKGLGEYQKISI